MEDVPVPQGTYQGGSLGYRRFPAADWPASGQQQYIAGGATQQQQPGRVLTYLWHFHMTAIEAHGTVVTPYGTVRIGLAQSGNVNTDSEQ